MAAVAAEVLVVQHDQEFIAPFDLPLVLCKMTQHAEVKYVGLSSTSVSENSAIQIKVYLRKPGNAIKGNPGSYVLKRMEALELMMPWHNPGYQTDQLVDLFQLFCLGVSTMKYDDMVRSKFGVSISRTMDFGIPLLQLGESTMPLTW